MTAADDAPVLNPAAVHVLRVDPAFASVIRTAGPFDLQASGIDAFNSLARAIVFQQLAGNAARAIHGRFAQLYGGSPTAEAVLKTSIDDLRGVGLSRSKALSITDLALKTSDGTVPLDRIDELVDAEVVERLTAVRGIGRWTAEMFLLFQLRRPDVWPMDDYGVRKGYAQIHQLVELPTARGLEGLGEIYRPFRSAAAWYCWRAADSVLPAA